MPALDEGYPVTMSGKIITDLLRREMGFEGLIISDDLEMKAIIDNYMLDNAVVMSVEAGVDILIISKTEESQFIAIEALLKAVRDGRIPEDRIDLSYHRIRSLKERFLYPNKPGTIDASYLALTLEKHRETAEEIDRIYLEKYT